MKCNVHEQSSRDWRLGIDLGTASIGWAVLSNEESTELMDLGVRCFDAGVSGDIERGADESRATERRESRGPRRLTWRRQYRLRKVYRLLQQFGLLPSAEGGSHDERHQAIAKLDRRLLAEIANGDPQAAQQRLPYLLRAKALDEKLSRHALGRAIYHLAQRRGFLSNRKAAGDEKEDGVVKQGIGDLYQAMDEADARTLGEYFAGVDSENERRIRGRWTARQMYFDEFEQIWQSQAAHHPELDDEKKARIHEAIFYQRKLKSQKNLIGMCDLEPARRRAPTASVEFQEFRVLQTLNNVEVICPDGEVRPFSLKERERLVAHLAEKDKISFGGIRKFLPLKKSKQYNRAFTFNFEESGVKEIPGNRTGARLAKTLGDRWRDMPTDQRIRLVDEILAFESEDVLARRLENGWGFPADQARDAAKARLEQGHGSLSRKAIGALLPLLRQGIPYSTARKQIYPESFESTDPIDHLPALHECAATKTLRNPAVARALSELRKVINELIRQYGKPSRIRIELARELKHGRQRRKDMHDRNEKNRKLREAAKQKILDEMGGQECRKADILKVRLAEECNWQCPFTGRQISMKELVGDLPQFDIEHIIPRSLSQDNSFMNVTLCYHEENRNVKERKTPYQAYHGTDRWEEILDRVRRFTGTAAYRKLERFKTEKLPDADEFTRRQLVDTQYMSRLACDYLAVLFGGRVDSEGDRRVEASPGRVTAELRRQWGLNAVLGPSDNKDRTDHRHHAVDALVVALTGPRDVQILSRAAEEAERLGRNRLYAPIDPPWESLVDDARQVVDAIIVSRRVSRKLNGRMHKGTIYSHPKTIVDKKGKTKEVHYLRKPIKDLTKPEVETIVDARIRGLVQEKLAQLGAPPDKAFKDPNNHPYTRTRDGRVIPIHKVRVRKSDHPMAVGSGTKRRFVNPADNHHMEIVAVLDQDGKEKKWVGCLVSRFEAVRRSREGEPIITHQHGEGKRFKFSLAGGEYIEMEHEPGKRSLYRTVVISGNQVEFVLHSDARPSTVRKKEGGRVRCSPDRLRKNGARKVVVGPLGRVFPAND